MDQDRIDKMNDVLASSLRNRFCGMFIDRAWGDIHNFCITHGHEGSKRFPDAPERGDVIELFMEDMYNFTAPERELWENSGSKKEPMPA